MDLVGSIVNYAINSTDPFAIALRDILPNGQMFADFDYSGVTTPYCTVSDLHYENVNYSTASMDWIEYVTVQFTVYSSRETVKDILDALENAYLITILPMDNRTQIGVPYLTGRLIYRGLDHWFGNLNLSYYLNRQSDSIMHVTPLPFTPAELAVVGGPAPFQLLGNRTEFWLDDDVANFIANIETPSDPGATITITLYNSKNKVVSTHDVPYADTTNRFSFQVDLSKLPPDNYTANVTATG